MDAVGGALTRASTVLEPVNRIGGPDAHSDHHIAIDVVCHCVKVAFIFADAARRTVHRVGAIVLRQGHHVATENPLDILEVDARVEGSIRVDERSARPEPFVMDLVHSALGTAVTVFIVPSISWWITSMTISSP